MLRRILASLHLALCLLMLVVAPVLTAQPVATALPLPDSPAAAKGQPQAFDCANVTEIPKKECEALVALYNSTNGANWRDHTGWLQTTTPCGWYGVSCMAKHVSQLDLHDNVLSGTIPPQLGNLDALQGLYLALNYYLHGAIPSELGTLTSLQSLSLSVNQLSGPIPPGLGKLAALQKLYLDSNQLTGAIPPELGNLIALRSFNLYYNKLSGPIPPELGHLATLEWLGLGHNQFSGIIPPELGNLTALRMLSLEYNQFSGAIPAQLGNLVALDDLYLNNNQLSGPIPPELGNLTNIRARWTSEHAFGVLRPPPSGGYLYLYSNRLSGTVPVELSKLSAAAGIGLGCNQLSGPLPPEVGRALNAMYEGNVDYNMLTGYDPALSPSRHWYQTQTVSPSDLQVIADGATVTLTWTPIAYTEDGGFYEVSYATAPDGPYSIHGWTADKTASSYTVTGLRLDVTYYFRVRTFTAAHPSYWCNQQSALASDYSAVVSTGGATPTPSATGIPTATVTPTTTPTATPTPTVTSTATPAPARLWLPLVWR